MATTADSSNHHTPRGPGFAGDGSSSPQLRRSNLSSPWAQVVRGEPESMAAGSPPPSPSFPVVVTSGEQSLFTDCSALKVAPSSPPPPPPDNSAAELSDGGEKNNVARSKSKKPVWNKPSNGVVEVGPVMDAVSWPALSESTRASPKSSADTSPKATDGSVSTSQGPVIPLSPHKQSTPSANPNSTPNHAPVRQRSMKRGGGGGSHAGGGPSQSGFTRPPPPPPPLPVFQVPPNSFGTLIPAIPDSSPRETPYRGSRPVGGFVPQGPQPHMVNDHRSSSRRGNYGPRGDGPFHNNFGGRRDHRDHHDRGNYGNARDVHMQPQRGPPRGIVRVPPPPPPNAAPFITPQTVRPFPSPIGFADVSSQLCYYPPLPMDSFRGVPFIAPAPPAPLLIPVPDPPLHVRLLNQIEYYFSDANLIKDDFLKSNMDDQGWVSITLIAGFPRVKSLTNNIQLILDTLRTSTVVEVQVDKVRRRNDWVKWIPNSGRLLTESGSPSSRAVNCNMLATSFQKVTVDEVKSELNVTTEREAGSARQAQLANGGDVDYKI